MFNLFSICKMLLNKFICQMELPAIMAKSWRICMSTAGLFICLFTFAASLSVNKR